jgi:short-subunit dehydrogenase involved in D-alanine esterification of teichoic acids
VNDGLRRTLIHAVRGAKSQLLEHIAHWPAPLIAPPAIHSYSQSLRYQLKETNVEVIEIVPPYVQTTSLGERQANDPQAMPLDEFITEVMQILSDRGRGSKFQCSAFQTRLAIPAPLRG